MVVVLIHQLKLEVAHIYAREVAMVVDPEKDL